MKFNTKKSENQSLLLENAYLCGINLLNQLKYNKLMTKEDEAEVQRLLKNVDVTELMDLLMKHGNRYSRRILKFFRWFCKYVPITIMLFHAYGMWDFSQHPREMFITNNENFPCYLFIYFMIYILPMVAILASRFSFCAGGIVFLSFISLV